MANASQTPKGTDILALAVEITYPADGAPAVPLALTATGTREYVANAYFVVTLFDITDGVLVESTSGGYTDPNWSRTYSLKTRHVYQLTASAMAPPQHLPNSDSHKFTAE